MTDKHTDLLRGKVLINVPYFRDFNGMHRGVLAELLAAGLEPVYAPHSLTRSELLAAVQTHLPIAALAYEETWSDAVLRAAVGLKVLVKYGTGVSEIDADACRMCGVAMTNTRGCNIPTTAELTTWLLGASLRDVVARHNATAAGEWKQPLTTELGGKAVLLLGAGNLALRIAAYLVPIGAKVTACSRNRNEAHQAMEADTAALRALRSYGHAGSFTWKSSADLAGVLPEADIVISALPETPETRGLITRSLLTSFAKPIILGNMGRGSVIESEADLAQLLHSGRIRSFFADVWGKEPLPKESPLRTCERVLFSSHVGAATEENLVRCAATGLEIIRAALSGQPLPENRTWLVEPPL